jgi:hypothetical protein
VAPKTVRISQSAKNTLLYTLNRDSASIRIEFRLHLGYKRIKATKLHFQ